MCKNYNSTCASPQSNYSIKCYRSRNVCTQIRHQKITIQISLFIEKTICTTVTSMLAIYLEVVKYKLHLHCDATTHNLKFEDYFEKLHQIKPKASINHKNSHKKMSNINQSTIRLIF